MYDSLHPKTSSEGLLHALSSHNHNEKQLAAVHPNLSDEGWDKAIATNDASVHRELLRRPDLQSHHISKLMDHFIAHKKTTMLGTLASRPQTTTEQLHKIFDNTYHWSVKEKIFKNENVDDALIDKGLQDSDESVNMYAIQHPKVNTQHLEIAVNSPHRYVRLAAMQHPNATPELLDKWANKDSESASMVAQHPNTSPNTITKLLDHKQSEIATQAISHPKVNKKHLVKALKSPHESVRQTAIIHNKTDSNMLHDVLDNEPLAKVRRVVFSNPNANVEHISKGLRDPHPSVRSAAILNKHATPEQTSLALDDSHPSVAMNAVSYLKNPTSDHLFKAINHPNRDVRGHAILHQNVTRKHLQHVINNDPDQDVRETAKSELQWRGI